MSLLDEYRTNIQPRIEEGIHRFLTEVAPDRLKELIFEEAFSTVYSYEATQSALSKRRYSIGNEENLSVNWPDSHELVISSTAKMQGMDYGVDEADFVQGGYENYYQPYPRPFMENALDKYLAGEAGMDLQNALEGCGIETDAVVSVDRR